MMVIEYIYYEINNIFLTMISLYILLSRLGSHGDYNLGLCGYILLFLSYALICLTFPFSLTICLKVKICLFFCLIIYSDLGRSRI
jgi:hypothetical protein